MIGCFYYDCEKNTSTWIWAPHFTYTNWYTDIENSPGTSMQWLRCMNILNIQSKVQPFIIVHNGSSSKWRQKMKPRMRWLFHYLWIPIFFPFACWRIKNVLSIFSFSCDFDFFISDDKKSNKMQYYLPKTAVRSGDNERMINYEWPCNYKY